MQVVTGSLTDVRFGKTLTLSEQRPSARSASKNNMKRRVDVAYLHREQNVHEWNFIGFGGTGARGEGFVLLVGMRPPLPENWQTGG